MAGLRVCIMLGKTLTQVTPNRMCVTMVRELLTEAKEMKAEKKVPPRFELGLQDSES